jgi:predicted transposase/invertase (TIGR01784 family)
MMYLELPKFRKMEDQLESHFEKWLYAFKNMPALHDRPRKLQERIFTRLFEAANIAQFSAIERTEYEDSLKVYRDLKNSLDTALEEGREQGREEGRELGRAEGALEKARDIAKNLLHSGIEPQKIADITGLSVQEIKGLR